MSKPASAAMLALLSISTLMSVFSTFPVKSEDDFLLEIEIDKTTIRVGESIKITLTLKNTGTDDTTITYSPPLFDIFYYSHEGCFRWSDGKYFILLVLSVTLKPEENCSETLQWNLYQYIQGKYFPPKPGTYYLQGICRPAAVAPSTPAAITLVNPLRGDLNGDGKVNVQDITIGALAYGTKLGDQNWNNSADLDNNGWIDIIDLVIVAREFGKTI